MKKNPFVVYVLCLFMLLAMLNSFLVPTSGLNAASPDSLAFTDNCRSETEAFLLCLPDGSMGSPKMQAIRFKTLEVVDEGASSATFPNQLTLYPGDTWRVPFSITYVNKSQCNNSATATINNFGLQVNPSFGPLNSVISPPVFLNQSANMLTFGDGVVNFDTTSAAVDTAFGYIDVKINGTDAKPDSTINQKLFNFQLRSGNSVGCPSQRVKLDVTGPDAYTGIFTSIPWRRPRFLELIPTFTPVPAHSDTIGVYNSIGVFYLRNSNSAGGADITAIYGGDPSDLPVPGDWNGDGIDTIGVYRSSTGFAFLSDSNTSPAVDYSILFGNPGDTPFAGKWSADMTHDGIGVYRNSNGILYQRKSLTGGFDDFFAIFGNPGDQGVAGDWDNDGLDSIGIYRPSNQTWYLTNNSTPGGITFSDIDFVWNIDANAPVIGDWDGDGYSTVGYLTASGMFTLHSSNAAIGINNTFSFGPTDGKPIAGKWIMGSTPNTRSIISPVTGVQAGGNTTGENAD